MEPCNPVVRDLANQKSRNHFDPQTPDFWLNDARLYFVRSSVFVKSKEIFQKFHSYKTVGTINYVNVSCYVDTKGWFNYSCKLGN